MARDYASHLEDTKASNLGHLLLRTARLFNEAGLARVNARGETAYRPAHMQLFPHIDLDGTRQSVLADRVGISKQAIHQLVSDLETLGVVERVPDPADKRAKMVRFTLQGRADILRGLAVLAQLEADIAAQLSAETLAQLKDNLRGVLATLESWQ